MPLFSNATAPKQQYRGRKKWSKSKVKKAKEEREKIKLDIKKTCLGTSRPIFTLVQEHCSSRKWKDLSWLLSNSVH